MKLCWTDIDELAEILEEHHSEEDIMELRFTALRKMITELEEFHDDPERCNEKVLEAIQQAWYDLREEN